MDLPCRRRLRPEADGEISRSAGHQWRYQRADGHQEYTEKKGHARANAVSTAPANAG